MAARIHHKQDRGPWLVWADSGGNIYDEPGWHAAGRRGRDVCPLDPGEMIPLPEGSELFLLQSRLPIGFHRGKAAVFGRAESHHGGQPCAVAAFLAPAHTQFYLPACQLLPQAPVLPLYAYTAVAFMDGLFWVPARRVDSDPRQEPGGFDCDGINEGVRRFTRESPDNRLLRHLAGCAQEYFCPAARNFFLGRWEAPLPSSPACNARCLGCISSQPSGCCPATQDRIAFLPTAEELAEVAIGHFNRVPGGVASFGQGCEGEPLLVAETLERAVALIRKKTKSGTINCNSNGSIPDAVVRLAGVGLDSIRVSLNSARPEIYEAYYRPAGYTFADVMETIKAASDAGLFVSLNYFVFPGLTDTPEEMDALAGLLETGRVDMIQWRNLNIDPDLYFNTVGATGGSLGIPAAMDQVRIRFPRVRHGYFNPPLEKKKGDSI